MENVQSFTCANGRGRGRRSLSCLENDHNDLRRPLKNPPFPENSGQTSDDASPKITSTLSAEAPEFVPRLYSQSLQPQLQQDQLVNSYPVAIPDTSLFSSYTDQSVPMLTGPQLKYINHPVILQISDMVVTLTRKPHKFDQIATQMTSILSWKVKEEGLMKEIFSVIFEQGVGEPNFRFSGARLCQHLSKHVTYLYDGLSFKTILLQKCQSEFFYRENYLQNEPSRLCGFTLFMADIFTHLRTTAASQPLDKLREALINLSLTLMSNPTSSNLKCVAQVLKGTGSLLDAGGKSDMEVVMFRLKDVAMTAQIPVDTHTLLLSLIELRASNWGKTAESSQEQTSSPPADQDVPFIGTVYYGPGGEIHHIEDDLDDSASDPEDSYYNLPLQGDELEGEIAKAFEEFLREQQHP